MAAVALLMVSACASDTSLRADRQVAASPLADESRGGASGIVLDDDVPTDVATPRSGALPGSATRSAPPFDEMPRSAAPKGRSTALLTDVRTDRHDGFERIVFGFAGDERPGYQVEWVEGPVAAAGSGSIVNVAGTSRLRIIFDPASGVDLATGDVSYGGPSRLESPVDGSTVRDVVRSGDFEAVMTWVASTDEVVPFRVLSLSEPTRVVIDVAVPPAR